MAKSNFGAYGRCVVFLDGSNEGKCEVCGKDGELRPYGRYDKKQKRRLSICFDCGMKNKGECRKALGEIILPND